MLGCPDCAYPSATDELRFLGAFLGVRPTFPSGSCCPVGRSKLDPLLSAYAATWLESIRGLVRPRTFEGYEYRLERHILPRFGHRRLDEITVDDVLAVISELREAGYSGWSIRSILTPLSRLLSHAVRRDVIGVSPISKLDRTERPAVWAREQRVLNREEIGRLLQAAPVRTWR